MAVGALQGTVEVAALCNRGCSESIAGFPCLTYRDGNGTGRRIAMMGEVATADRDDCGGYSRRAPAQRRVRSLAISMQVPLEAPCSHYVARTRARYRRANETCTGCRAQSERMAMPRHCL